MPRRKKTQAEEPVLPTPEESAPAYDESVESYADILEEDYYEEDFPVEEDEPLDVAEEPLDVAEEEEEEPVAVAAAEPEEEVVEPVPPRYETRQEMLARLMRRLLGARERVRTTLERVRDINAQLRDAGPRPPERLKEQYQRAIAELSAARREENLARAELIQALNWRG
jgi:hypothetical protein